MQGAIDEIVSDTDQMLVVGSIKPQPNHEIKVLRQFLRNRVGGIIMAPLSNTPALTALLSQIDVPVVLLDQHVSGTKLDHVTTDNRIATTVLTEYLLRL